MIKNLSNKFQKIINFLRADNIFASILFMVLLSIIEFFIYITIFDFITKNIAIVYTLTYTISILIFSLLFFKDDLLQDAKTIKKTLKKNKITLLISFIIFTTFTLVSNTLISKITNNIPLNEALTRQSIINSPILMGISVLFLGPITEELIYRMTFKKITKHRLITYIIYSSIFALLHITNFKGIELLFIIPYFFLSLNFGYGLYKTNNIYMSMIIHILYNLLNIVLLLII